MNTIGQIRYWQKGKTFHHTTEQSEVCRRCCREAPNQAAVSFANATVNGDARTSNMCEGWNNKLFNLVGHAHPSIWRVIEWCQKEEATARTIKTFHHTTEQSEVCRRCCREAPNQAAVSFAMTRPCKQLYTIRVPFKDVTVTAVYAFLPNKCQDTYRELFQSIDDNCPASNLQINVQTIITDFEVE
jgi:hypothetical protein